MLIAIGLIILGFVLLLLGAEALVRGAASLALRLGVSSLVVGLTVVACGTSMPEMAVSVLAALKGNADIAVGNVVGSNIFNVALILGLAAAIFPISCHAAFVRREVPIMIGVSLLLPAFALGGGWLARSLGNEAPATGLLWRWQGVVFVLLGLLYTWFLYRLSRREGPEVRAEFEQSIEESGLKEGAKRPIWFDALLILAGVALLVGGSKALVDGAMTIARTLGVSELIIGLTIVAAGTSLPELATSVVAAARKEPDISVGNVIGSNIFNILSILGVSAIVKPINVSYDVFVRDIPVMVVVAALCYPIMRTGGRISRAEGFLLMAVFGAYIGWLVIAAAGG